MNRESLMVTTAPLYIAPVNEQSRKVWRFGYVVADDGTSIVDGSYRRGLDIELKKIQRTY